jgi:hypothetical protein
MCARRSSPGGGERAEKQRERHERKQLRAHVPDLVECEDDRGRGSRVEHHR